MELFAFLWGAAWCGAGVYAFRLLPQKWLCEYGEAPTAAHVPQARRLPVWALALSALCGGAACVLSMRTFGGAWAALLLGPLVAALLLCAVCDAKYCILPDELLLCAAVLGAALAWAGGAKVLHTAWCSPLLGGALGFGGLWLVQAVAAKLLHAEAMGFGDVKLLGALGLLLGAKGLLAAVLAAVFSAALVFAVLIMTGRRKGKDQFPFGPFLAAGALAAVVFAPEWQRFAAWYLGLF